MKSIFAWILLFSLSSWAKDYSQLPTTQGWLGGDAAYSVELGQGRILWLFGDSFVSPDALKYSAEARRKSYFIHNSIGISSEKIDDMKYYWGKSEKSPIDAFFHFPEADSDSFFWPRDAAILDDTLVIFLLEVKATGAENSLDFKMPGVWMVKVNNFMDSPDQWNTRYVRLNSPEVILPAAAAMKEQATGALYLYSNIQCSYAEAKQFCETNKVDKNKRPMILVKMNSLRRGDPLEYLYESGKFEAFHGYDDLKMVVDSGNEEMTVRYVPELKKYVMIYNDTMANPEMKSGILSRTSDSLVGPWTMPKTIVHFPILHTEDKRFSESALPYAGKGHFWRRNGKVILTSVYNFVVNGDLIYEFDESYVPLVQEVSISKILGK